MPHVSPLPSATHALKMTTVPHLQLLVLLSSPTPVSTATFQFINFHPEALEGPEEPGDDFSFWFSNLSSCEKNHMQTPVLPVLTPLLWSLIPKECSQFVTGLCHSPARIHLKEREAEPKQTGCMGSTLGCRSCPHGPVPGPFVLPDRAAPRQPWETNILGNTTQN